MTYALAWPLQEAIFARLTSDSAVSALLGDALYDAPEHASVSADGIYAILGDEIVSPRSDRDADGAIHQVTISIHAADRGFARAKQAAGAICDALIDADLPLSRGAVVGVFFLGASTAREDQGASRRIDLRFRILVEDFPAA